MDLIHMSSLFLNWKYIICFKKKMDGAYLFL